MLISMDNNKLKKLLGQRVLELRRQKKLTQQQVADKMGVDIRTYSRIEKGVNFPSRYIITLAEALGVSVSQLFEFEHLDITRDAQIDFIKHCTDNMPAEQLTIIYRFINSIYN